MERNGNNELKMNIKEYILNLKDIKYKVEISIINENENKKILFIIKELNLFQNHYYKSEFSLDELKKINKIFRAFDTIDEVYEKLNILFSKTAASLKIESNEIFLCFSFSNFLEDISIKIKKDIIINQEEINELIIKEINHMRENYLNDIKNLEQKIKNLEEQNKDLIKTVEELRKSLNEFSVYKNNIEKYNINSEIVNEIDEVKLIYDRLTSKGIFKNGNPKFQLIYRASRDGDDSNIYKKKIQGIKNFLCIIQTKKGCKFGGYAETSPDFSKCYFNDKNAFIFSLDKKKIYEYLEDNCSVSFIDGIGPDFSFGFRVECKNFFNGDNNIIYEKNLSRFYYMDKDYEINNYEKNFIINELEVFQVI